MSKLYNTMKHMKIRKQSSRQHVSFIINPFIFTILLTLLQGLNTGHGYEELGIQRMKLEQAEAKVWRFDTNKSSSSTETRYDIVN